MGRGPIKEGPPRLPLSTNDAVCTESSRELQQNSLDFLAARELARAFPLKPTARGVELMTATLVRSPRATFRIHPLLATGFASAGDLESAKLAGEANEDEFHSVSRA